MKTPPSPVDHPAAYGTLSTATIAGFLVAEANSRLGFDLNIYEATMIVGVVGWTYFAAFGKKK
jgi:hypothetical protein